MAEIQGLSELLAKLDRLPGQMHAQLRNAMQRTVERTAADARKLAPGRRGSQSSATGISLRQGITHHAEGSGGNIQGRVESIAPHSAYVEFGTGPKGAANHGGISPHVAVSYRSTPWVYPVTTSQKVRLKKSEGGGSRNETTTRFYRTSGQAARPFMYPASQQNKETFANYVRSAAHKAMKGGNGI